MIDNTKAILNGIATTTMQEMLRKGELFKLPSSLGSFIANKGWEAVEYLEPESNSKKVATFDGLMAWVGASPVRGGLGTRIDKVVKLIIQPLDSDAAPECCKQLLDALEGMEAQALAPMISAAAAANAKLMGNKEWRVIADKADAAVKRPGGGQPGNANAAKNKTTLDNIQSRIGAPTGTSAAAGLRKLRRYADSDSLCEQHGVTQDAVTEQYGKTLRGEKSVHRALIDCGLRKKATTAAGLGIDGPPDDVARRIIKRLGKDRAALLVTELTALLTQ